METAKEVLSDLGISGVFSGERNMAMCESIIKLYATEVAKETLRKASEQAECVDVNYDKGGYDPYWIVDEQSILSTQILTP